MSSAHPKGLENGARCQLSVLDKELVAKEVLVQPRFVSFGSYEAIGMSWRHIRTGRSRMSQWMILIGVYENRIKSK
jgi:hypothetical protein